MKTIHRLIRSALQGLLIVLLVLYRYLVSPVLHVLAPGSGCRFQPTCSEYALEAIRIHGPFHGSWLALRRLGRCHPWGGHGFDPVPGRCSCAKPGDPEASLENS
ncbi:MAG: membrane protein insertion efficiency factor YidD [Oceanipulchritudo sp.]